MESVLAEMNWEGITSIVAVLAAGGIGASQLRSNKKIKSNGASFNKELCDERHKNLDRRDAEMQQDLGNINGKLDRLVEHLLGK